MCARARRPSREHKHTLAIKSFYIDKYAVTTTNYSAYRTASGYTPKDTYASHGPKAHYTPRI